MKHETMEYKGYTASIRWNEEETSFIGNVIGIDHIIQFRGATLPEISTAFGEMIDWYLEDCAEEGIEPNKPPTEIMISFPPQIYAQAYGKAESTGMPLQQFLQKAVQKAMV